MMLGFKIKKNIKIAALTLMLVFPFCVISQDSNLGNWLIYRGNKKLNSKWKYLMKFSIGINIPLQYKEDGNNPLYLSVYNEIFLNTESSVFNRNR